MQSMPDEACYCSSNDSKNNDYDGDYQSFLAHVDNAKILQARFGFQIESFILIVKSNYIGECFLADKEALKRGRTIWTVFFVWSIQNYHMKS